MPSPARRVGSEQRSALWRDSEALARAFLIGKGLRVVAANVRAGRLEIDLVAVAPGFVVICEVRSRSSLRFGHPAESVDAKKRQRLRRAAPTVLRALGLSGRRVRFDVIGVVYSPRGAHLDHYPDAF